jgi:hypothetical protein
MLFEATRIFHSRSDVDRGGMERMSMTELHTTETGEGRVEDEGGKGK